MTVLVTGAAGFVGFHVAAALLKRGERVIGVDIVNDYYDPGLKEARLQLLAGFPAFQLYRMDLADRAAMEALGEKHGDIAGIVHLAAQAGVRYSLVNPRAYVHSNLVGHVEVLELARQLPNLDHLVYASSSSVYGATSKSPFSLDDPCDTPKSLYAATKKSDELLTYSFSNLFGLPATGLRFFTVYGDWGRPDMSYFIFTKAILEERSFPLFNNGEMERDFTHVDDVVDGILAALERPPSGEVPHYVYNLGNNRPEKLERVIDVIAQACGKEALPLMAPMQPGDVVSTCADISEATRDLGFVPRIPIDEGMPRFVKWYRSYYNV